MNTESHVQAPEALKNNPNEQKNALAQKDPSSKFSAEVLAAVNTYQGRSSDEYTLASADAVFKVLQKKEEAEDKVADSSTATSAEAELKRNA